MRKDILTDSEGDLEITNGDLAAGASDEAHIEHILTSNPGDWKESPQLGFGIMRQLNGPLSREAKREMMLQLKSDGYDINDVNVMVNISEDISKDIANRTIPLLSNALFWLDGSISGSEFVDKTGNGRNFTINNKDFTTEYFPYKSEATISAPVGDAILIAADINNFLYDSGGTPNEIPVVSLFQNIDYENKLFSRHISQTVDSNGIEVSEPYIKDIVLYDTVLTGGNLASAIAYYYVPTEDTGAYWADPDGNDTTGDGSKLSPWLTLDKAVDTVNDGSLIYAKSNNYSGDAALFYLYNIRNNKIQGIGLAILETTSSSYGVRLQNANIALFKGVYLKPAASNAIRTIGTVDLVISRVFIVNDNTSGIVDEFKELRNSIISGSSTIMIAIYVNGINRIIDCCLFINSTTYVIDFLGSGDHVVSNSLFKPSDGKSLYLRKTSGSVTIKGNTFSPVAGGNIINSVTDSEISILNNVLNVVAGATDHAIEIFNTITNQAIVRDNIIRNEGGNTLTMILGVDSSLKAENNIIKASSTLMAGGADIRDAISSPGAYVGVEINNNKVSSKRSSSYILAIGSETTNSGDNAIPVIKMEKNHVTGLDESGAGTAQTTHGLLVGFQINAQVRYNNIIGSYYGVVLKGTTTTIYTSGGANYNIIRECKYAILVKGAQSINIVNNTIINKVIDSGYGVALLPNTGGDDADNCVVKNNIFIFLGTGVNMAINIGAGTNNVIDYNLYYSPNGALQFSNNGATRTFSQWQSDGYDTNSKILSDEEFESLFSDFENNNFIINVGSIAEGYGDDLGEDYDTGLDPSTNWGNENSVPNVITKQQAGNNDCGAYVR